MDIQQIKAAIAAKTGKPLPVLDMQRQMAEDKVTPQPWLSHWDNDNRVRVTMHEEVFNKIKEDPTVQGLAVKYEEIPAAGDRKPYVRFVVITPTSIEASF